MKVIHQIISKKNFTTMLIVTLLTQAACVLPAFAGDNKVYPGSGCLPFDVGSSAGLTRGGGKAINNSQANIFLRCPIVRDVTTGGIPSSFIDVTGNVRIDTCTLNTYTVTGTLVAQNEDSDSNFTNIAGNSIKRIDIQNANKADQGAYEIACALPPGASLVRYTLAE